MAIFKSCLKPPLTFPAYSGDICSFSSYHVGLPLKSHTVEVKAVQASGTPTPANPIPISGWDSIHIQNTAGINQWDGNYSLGRLDITTGEPNPQANGVYSVDYIAVEPNMSLYIYSGFNVVILEYDDNRSYLSVYTICNNSVITLGANTHYIKLYTTNSNDYQVSVNYPSTDTDYHAFEGQSITVQIGSTVYGGTYNAITGVLTVDNFVFVGNSGLIVSKISAVDNLSTYLIRTSTNNFPNAVNNTCISSHFSRYIESGSGRMAQATNDIYLVIDNTLLSEDTESGFVTWLTNNNVTFVYELATPTTIQLTPIQLETLLAQNNIWCDTGDTSLQYIKLGR